MLHQSAPSGTRFLFMKFITRTLLNIILYMGEKLFRSTLHVFFDTFLQILNSLPFLNNPYFGKRDTSLKLHTVTVLWLYRLLKRTEIQIWL